MCAPAAASPPGIWFTGAWRIKTPPIRTPPRASGAALVMLHRMAFAKRLKTVKKLCISAQKFLDFPDGVLYNSQAPVKRAHCDDAGDCSPGEVTSAEYVRKIGRLRGSFHGVYRPGWVEPACYAPVLFMPGSDTHGNVD